MGMSRQELDALLFAYHTMYPEPWVWRVYRGNRYVGFYIAVTTGA